MNISIIIQYISLLGSTFLLYLDSKILHNLPLKKKDIALSEPDGVLISSVILVQHASVVKVS